MILKWLNHLQNQVLDPGGHVYIYFSSFHELYHFNFKSSKNVVTVKHNFIKIITMMVGELDSSNIGEFENYGDYFEFENMYNTAIFISFVFLMCIIILSLFEGIAVGEIKDVLDKAHIEIISSNIVYVLKIQSILYRLHRFFTKNKEPLFMNFTEHKLNWRRSNARFIAKNRKKQRNVIKKIEVDLKSLSANFTAMSKQIGDLTSQVRCVKRILE